LVLQVFIEFIEFQRPSEINNGKGSVADGSASARLELDRQSYKQGEDASLGIVGCFFPPEPGAFLHKHFQLEEATFSINTFH
jgi:hypothetical protein